MTAGAMVLSTASPAHSAATPASSGSLNEDPVAGQVAATVTVSKVESSRQARRATVTKTRKLTSKVRAAGKATVVARRSAKAKATVKVTRYAPTAAQATAEATQVATKAARQRALKAAKAKASKLALARAKEVATGRATNRALANARSRFVRMELRRARAQKGKPYRWGAKGPNAFDCSGLVNYVLKGVGVNKIPRTSSGLSKKMRRVSKSQRKWGDLVFFSDGGRVYHVGIYAGKGMIWDAPGSGRSVQKVKIWTSSHRFGRVPALA
jgi:cell wall-associated NlpC family hydrolase